MIFKPSTVACLWDTWLYYHKGKHYLYYLHNSRLDARWDGIGVAVSDDGVHFADYGSIIQKTDNAIWLGSGMVWRAAEKFLINFSESRNNVQTVHFAESDDLLHWQRLPDAEYVCRSDPRWYADRPTLSPQRWDGIWVLPRADAPGYVGFVTAVAKEGPPGLCGTAGCVVSDDGRHFRAAPPVVETGYWADGVEVDAVERIGSRYYMLLGVFHAPLGARHMARLPTGEVGMYVASSDSLLGPYRVSPQQPILLGSSPHPFTYFARFYRIGNEVLLNHHTVARTSPMVGHNAGPDVHFSPLKAIRQDADGVIALAWWPGNEALKGTTRPVHLDGAAYTPGLQQTPAPIQDGQLRLTAPANGMAILSEHFNFERGVILDADMVLHATHGPLSSVGLFIEGLPHETGSMLLAQSNGWLMVGPFNGHAFKPEYGQPFPFTPRRTMRWRLLARGPYVELYVDNLLVQCYTLPHAPKGRIGFTVEAGAVTVTNVHAWEMSL